MGEKSYISFDVYDTLIKRVVPTERLYRLMEKEISSKFQIDNFAEKRMKAENRLKSQGAECFSLTDIYNMVDFKGLSQRCKQELLQYEEECEIYNTLPNEKGKKLYTLYSANATCICISDMYLSSTVIRKALDRNGYSKIEKVYVSCEEKCSKRQGTLFKRVLDNLNIDSRKLVHIGDAKRSDYLNPKFMGIHSKLIINHNKRLIDTNNYFYDIGFSVFGPVFYEFIVWLKDKADGKQLYFLSREGEFLKQCYEQVHATKENMLFVSRESIIHGSIASMMERMEISDILKHITVQRNETTGRLLRRLGLEQKKYEQLLKLEGMQLTDSVSEKLVWFIDRYRTEIILDTKKYEKNFAEYMKQMIATDYKNILLVDIGWNGSMQALITDYLNMVNYYSVVEGAYLGCTNESAKYGYLFHTKNLLCADILSFSTLLEYVSMPPYGTVKGYKKEAGMVKPIFGECESSLEARYKIDEIQRGILDLIGKLALWRGQTVFDKEKIINNLLNLGRNPKMNDVRALGSCMIYENGRIYPLVDAPSGKDFLNPKSVYNKFMECGWKAGWMRQTLKLPLPWYRLLRLLRKKADKVKEQKTDEKNSTGKFK